LREDFTLEEFSKIFQEFNNAVYRGDAKKLAYKSWRNINSWRTKGKYEKMRISKEWVRRRNDDDSYSDLEIIFVGPYDPVRVCPNPEELDLNDGSFGSWLDGVLVRESLMALNSCYSDIDKVAYAGATAYESLISTGADVTSLRSAMESLQSGICKLDDTNSYCYYSTGADKNNTVSQTYELRSDDLYIDGVKQELYDDALNSDGKGYWGVGHMMLFNDFYSKHEENKAKIKELECKIKELKQNFSVDSKQKIKELYKEITAIRRRDFEAKPEELFFREKIVSEIKAQQSKILRDAEKDPQKKIELFYLYNVMSKYDVSMPESLDDFINNNATEESADLLKSHVVLCVLDFLDLNDKVYELFCRLKINESPYFSKILEADLDTRENLKILFSILANADGDINTAFEA
jgi:hypothetical protein